MRTSVNVLLKAIQFFVVHVAILIGVLFVQHPAAAESAGANVLFILDGSGSMWGRLDNVEKIVIAKERMTELVQELEGVNMGLIVYGHRRKGDCDDIEIMVPLGAGNKEAVIQQIQSISPKGKTPITKSIELAAQQLETIEEETEIVLVSDGLETCEGDPCAYVQSLKEKGIKFKMDVVGFDISEEERGQLECIAKAGGGRYFTAQNAMQLKEAFTEVKKEVIEKVLVDNSYALQFDGVNDYVNIRLDKSLINHLNLTLEAWIEVSYQKLRDHYVVISNLGVWRASGGYQISLASPAPPGIVPMFRDNKYSDLGFSSSTRMVANRWYHIAVTYRYKNGKTTVRLYVNGKRDKSQTFTGKINYDFLHNLTIGTNIDGVGGRRTHTREFMGRIDEVRIWNVVRSQAKIQAAMSSHLSGNEPGLMAYWKFNEGRGTIAADSSGNGNTGRLINGPTWTTDTPF